MTNVSFSFFSLTDPPSFLTLTDPMKVDKDLGRRVSDVNRGRFSQQPLRGGASDPQSLIEWRYLQLSHQPATKAFCPRVIDACSCYTACTFLSVCVFCCVHSLSIRLYDVFIHALISVCVCVRDREIIAGSFLISHLIKQFLSVVNKCLQSLLTADAF